MIDGLFIQRAHNDGQAHVPRVYGLDKFAVHLVFRQRVRLLRNENGRELTFENGLADLLHIAL